MISCEIGTKEKDLPSSGNIPTQIPLAETPLHVVVTLEEEEEVAVEEEAEVVVDLLPHALVEEDPLSPALSAATTVPLGDAAEEVPL